MTPSLFISVLLGVLLSAGRAEAQYGPVTISGTVGTASITTGKLASGAVDTSKLGLDAFACSVGGYFKSYNSNGVPTCDTPAGAGDASQAGNNAWTGINNGSAGSWTFNASSVTMFGSAPLLIQTGTVDSTKIVFKLTSATPRVGIGLTSPAASLDIDGTGDGKGTSKMLFKVAGSTLNVNSLGRVGLGTTNPGTGLDISMTGPALQLGSAYTTAQNPDFTYEMIGSSTGQVMWLTAPNSANSTAMIGFGMGPISKGYVPLASLGLHIDQAAEGDLVATTGVFGTNPVERIRITHHGKVGVGITAPIGDFHVLAGTVDTAKLHIGATDKPACLMLGDTDKGGCTECFALNGTLSCTTDADCVCDGS